MLKKITKMSYKVTQKGLSKNLVEQILEYVFNSTYTNYLVITFN